MAREEIIGNATLYLGDCREVLPTLPKAATLQEDLSELADEGYAFSFMSTVGGGRRRLYSLTKSGLIRAKQLKEMSE